MSPDFQTAENFEWAVGLDCVRCRCYWISSIVESALLTHRFEIDSQRAGGSNQHSASTFAQPCFVSFLREFPRPPVRWLPPLLVVKWRLVGAKWLLMRAIPERLEHKKYPF